MKQLFQSPHLSVLCISESDCIVTSTPDGVLTASPNNRRPNNDSPDNSFAPSRSANNLLHSLSDQH